MGTKHIDRTKLTQRESEILSLRDQRLSYAQIAAKLHITEGTVSSRLLSARRRIRAKQATQEASQPWNS